MDEIENIMRQFRHGAMDSEWKQFIKSIKISNIHGWTGQELILNFSCCCYCWREWHR